MAYCFVIRNNSDETFCSDSSNGVRSKCRSATNILHKRRVLHPLLGSSSPYHSSNSMSRLIPLQSKGSMSASAQKIMSARMLRVKQLQNELSEAQLQLSELAAENRALRTLQKRQEVLLKRYESKQAALPQIMHSYEEEVRILSSRLKQARAQIRTLEERLRTRDNELSSLKDKCHHLEELSQSKHLRQREQLQQRLELLQDQLHEKEKTVQLLTRKVMLEGKNYKHQLAVEATRHRTVRNELANALEKISELEIQLKKKDKFLASSLPRPVSLLSLQTPTRFRGFQSQTRTEIVQINHSNHVLEEEDNVDEDEDGEEIDQRHEDDQQQDYSESSYTDPHTNTSQMSSLEIGKEMGESNPSNVSMSLDYQAKRLQFSNHYQKNANAVQETTYTESANGLSSRSLSLDQPKLEIDMIFKPNKEVPFHPETDRSIRTTIECSSSSIPAATGNFSIQNVDESRRGLQSSLEDEKKKGNNLEFLSSLASDMNINEKTLKYQAKFVDRNDTGEDSLPSGQKKDIVLDSSTKEDKVEESDILAKQSKKDSLTGSFEPQCIIQKNSLTLDNHKDVNIGSRRSSVENVAKGSAPVDDTPQRSQEITWEELEQRMKSHSSRVKSEVEKHLLDTSAMERPKSKTIDESKKKSLLDVMKSIDDNMEPLVNKHPTIPSSLFVGSVRDSSTHSKPFTSQQLSKRKKNFLEDLFPNAPPDILVDPVADGVEPTVFKRN
ncbi:putative leucine-rich repeat-containing protein DDB_G0290503 isoform X2 [Anabrus simplex]|uniref:putative leucine-rich repeat-containing protein DDB_G0290503 isoform X2 n=1 Tax=Anabrus simplex TaxID=316456 RepID=UPI0035A34A83